MENIFNVDLIEDYRIRNRLSKTEFCKNCKISCQTYKKILRGSMDINTMSIVKIAYYTKIELYKIFKN